jgi:hypothetical protein
MEPSPRYVEIVFDCLPLRSVGRLDIPIDASPKYRQAEWMLPSSWSCSSMSSKWAMLG